HKGIDLPFEMEGSISATPDGNIRMHADKVKAGPLPVKGLLHLFGEDLAKLVNVNEARGVRVEGDDVIMMPSRMTPPPHLFGRLVKACVDGNRIVQVFQPGMTLPALKPPLAATGYIYQRNGNLRFGKLTMHNSDLQILSMVPSGSFDFSLPD